MAAAGGSRMNTTRAFLVCVLVGVTGAIAATARARGVSHQAHLGALPYRLVSWTGRDAGELDAETVRILAADSYLNRTYADASRVPVELYVAYYSRQRPGVSIHSPLHCLPGTGWEPLLVSTVDVAQADGSIGQVRRLLVRKNLDRALVFYWYAVHGRMLADEMTSKLWLLHDSIRLGRSDAALIRIVVPVGAADDGMTRADREGLAFARDVLPFLPRLWS
jgi:EpsI family protein